ncbi:MAG: NfeD family protein [Pirellulaceae bacterium]
MGDRDELAKRQVRRIADVNRDALQRPVVVLRFAVDPIANVDLEAGSGMGSRGSQFERCLSLARFLTSPDAARVRLVAYLPDTVEGHAVLPVLACEEILANSTAELGRAAIDEPLDASIEGAYRDVVSRRATLPLPIVQAMLDGTAEVYLLELADGGSLVADRAEAAKRREAGEVLREETIWAGGGLAQFSGQQLRNRRWIARTLDDPTELSDALDLSGALRTSQQLPRDWRPVRLSLSGELSTSRVNQIIRAVDDAVDKQQVNLLVVELSQTTSNFSNASRLANYIAGLNAEQVYSLGIVTQSLTGPASLIPVACDEAVLLSTASLGPMIDAIGANGLGAEGNVGDAGRAATARLVLGDLAETTNRPLPLLSALIDPSVIVNEYVHQDSGKRAIFAEWQIAKQANAQQWLAKKRVAGGEPLPNDIALRYRLVDAIDDTSGLALSRLGVEEMPPELKTPWLDATIQRVLAQGWLPRLLLTIGFFALMIELGNPGISAGGLLASLCFLGFFWIEGLNGNVEALEVLLFVGGLIALGIELFVLPGFGLFGIGGLVMLLVSVVLASQTFIWPTTSAQLSEVASNLFWVSCMAMGGMIGLLFMHRQLENSPLLRWVTLEPASADELDELEMREAIVHREHLLGQEGITTTRLNPSGKAQFGRDIVAVVGTGKMIGEGVPVRVVEVRGNLILVEDCADM